MEKSPSEGPLRKLQKRLYEKEDTGPARAQTAPPRPSDPAPEGWGNSEENTAPLEETMPQPHRKKPKRMSFAYKMLLAAGGFFALSLAVFLFVFLGGTNIISTKNVAISVDGPTSVAAADELSFEIRIENKNDAALESATLTVEFPDGFQRADRAEEPLSRITRDLGTIARGEAVTETVDAVVFGQRDEKKEIAVSVEYRTENSNAIFVAEATHAITITSSPVDISLTVPEETSSGARMSIRARVRSEAAQAIPNVLVELSYPFGFSFAEASRAPVSGENVWRIPRLAPGEEWVVTVEGALEGTDNEEKTFRLRAGEPRNAQSQIISVAYGEEAASARIVRPFLSAELFLNGTNQEPFSVVSGETIEGEIVWRNNTPGKLSNIAIDAALSGNASYKQTVNSRSGFYRSAENVIEWDKNTASALAEAAPGDSGRLRFSLTPTAQTSNSQSHNASGVTIAVTARADRQGGGTVERSSSRAVKLTTRVTPSQRVLYYSGPFENSGPLPPAAERTTTYTVVWSLVNALNDVGGAVLQAPVPPSVGFAGVVSPSDARITFDSENRVIRWNIGRIAAGRGVTSAPREAAFQIRFTPSVSQVGEAPTLIGPATFQGQDTYTDADLGGQADAATTRLLRDPEWSEGQARVVSPQ